MRAAGKDEYRPGPNMFVSGFPKSRLEADEARNHSIMGANAQVALEKFARYFDVEARLVPVSAETSYCLSPKKAMEYVDEVRFSSFFLVQS